jgi:transposase
VSGTPSVEGLYERLAQRDELIEALQGELARMRVRVAELEARLGQTSKNSSKPPSSDGLAQPAPKSLRKRSGRKSGGQAGHPGLTLAPVAVPDEVIAHEPGCCRGCGDDLSGAPEVGREHRQVFDIPPTSVRVVEHQLVKRRCTCGTATSADAPEGVTAPVQYARGSPRSLPISTSGSFCLRGGPPPRWPSCLALRSRKARSRRWPPARRTG